MDGQAENAPETLEGLAQFLMDNPEDGPDKQDDAPNDSEPDEDNSDDSDAPGDAEDESDDDESDAENAEDQTSAPKFKVTVKGEDGQDQQLEVDQKELIAGYQRQSDYTRKTQELAKRESDAFELVTSKIEEGRSHYLKQAQLAHAAVQQLAGIRSPEEMAQLSQTDPAAWVAEQQRMQAINGVMQQIEHGMQAEMQRVQAQRVQQMDQARVKAWEVLDKEGIDKSKLAKIYEVTAKKYGLTNAEFGNLYDPRYVLVLRDAAAYQALKDKQPAVKQKVADAPKLPPQKQTVPRAEQRTKQLETRFKSGRAKLDDLADWISTKNL